MAKILVLCLLRGKYFIANNGSLRGFVVTSEKSFQFNVPTNTGGKKHAHSQFAGHRSH